VVEVRPWDRETLEAALEPVLEGEGSASWVDLLDRATGGWPARVVRAVTCCARAGLGRPDPGGLSRALADGDLGDAVEIDRGQARAVLEAAWTDDLDPTLPIHLHDGDRPLGWAVVAARKVLGAEVPSLARAVLERQRGDEERIGLALALDADAADEIDALLRGETALTMDDSAMVAALQWLEEGGARRVGAAARTMVVRHLIREGEAKRALSLARTGDASTASELEAARALQQLGRSAEALSVLEAIADASELQADTRLLDLHTGLRWRVLVDLGRGDEALAEAQATDLQTRSGTGTAVALLWAGYAALTSGNGELARAWLGRAEEACPGDDPEQAGVRARVLQLLGNLALASGDLLSAEAEHLRAAAAFDLGRETVGRLLVRGSLAGIAVPTHEVAQGVKHGRAAMRGLLARGLLQSLPEVGANLVQLLAKTGAVEEGRSLHEMLAHLVSASTQLGPLARAHLQRMAAELAAADLLRRDGDPPTERRRAERLFVAAARALEDAGSGREAVEAWLRGAALARVDGRLPAAAKHLGHAAAKAEAQADDESLLGVALERVAQAAAGEDSASVEAALTMLADLPRVPELVACGQLDLAWTYDKVLLPALRQLDADHKTRRAVARRMLGTLEVLMKKASTLDRAAVRSSLLSDGGDRGPLRDLIEELGEAASRDAPESAQVLAPASEGVRSHRLLRMYRRLAREDDLERLLEQVVEAIMDLTEAERGVVVVQPADDGPRIEVARELSAGSDGVAFSRSVIERVLESGEPVLSVDAAEDDRFDQSRSISHLNLRSVLAVPLRFRGEVLGAAYVDHRLRRGNFDEGDLARVEEFAELAALAVAHASALGAVRSQAAEIDRQRLEVSRLLELREAEVQGLRDQVRSTQVPERKVYRGMVGATAAMQDVFRLVDRLSESDVPVVLYGESGTGKELVARAIHEAGPRAAKPFVAENCAAIPETLLESVLFGHARGAFTGAQRAKAGLFEAAGGGTIFLDEIGETSPAMQTKLLRVLQEGEIRRIGENVARKVDVRVIAASNVDLDEIVERGKFRRDLYYRLNVVKLELPPLRRRSEDIPALVTHFLARHDPDGRVSVSAAAMRALATFSWPGNVRQIENEVQRWVALCEGKITPDDLSPAITGSDDDELDPDDLRIRPRVDLLERELIGRALERTAGNQTRAAELLGLSRYGLQKKLRRLSEEGEE
jgi:transcriptional regulator with GAF, ATPase, and Fis domain